MLYVNKHSLSRFSSYTNGTVKDNGHELNLTNGWDYAYADYNFPEIVKNEIWVTAFIFYRDNTCPRIGIGVKFANGAVHRSSYSDDTFFIPYGNGTGTSSNNFSFNPGLPAGTYTKIRIHLWVDKSDSKKLWAEFFAGDNRVPIGGTERRWVTGSSAIEGFTYIRIGGSGKGGYATFIKDIIVSDKEISAGTQIMELPISSVSGWVANENNSFTATEFDTEGTLIPDAIELAKLKDYNIQGSVLIGTYLRQGDNIKNLHIKTSGQEVDLPLEVGVSTKFQKDLETTSIDSLSSIIISPKG